MEEFLQAKGGYETFFYGIHLPKTMKFHMFWDDLHWPA